MDVVIFIESLGNTILISREKTEIKKKSDILIPPDQIRIHCVFIS
jgi:hypothetical protein